MKLNIEGFIHGSEVEKYYSQNDIFILPTNHDRASISVSEALFSGLFVIGSIYDGSAVNFIKDRINGLIINPDNCDSIENAISWSIKAYNKGLFDRNQIIKMMDNFSISKYSERLTSWDILK